MLLSPRPTLSASPTTIHSHIPPFLHSLSPHKCISIAKLSKATASTGEQGSLLAFRSTDKRSLFGPNSLFTRCKISSTCVALVDDSAESLSQSSYQTDLKVLSLFQELGLGNRDTEVLFGSNPAVRFTSFEAMRDRVGLLRSVGIAGLVLGQLITKRPDVLTAEGVGYLIHFIRDELEGKVEVQQLVRLLNSTEPIFFMGFGDKVKLLLRDEVPKDKLFHVLNNVNLSKALCLKSTEEIDKMLSYLSHFGGIELIIKRPAILNYDLETQLIPRIGVLLQLSGEDKDATAAVLLKLPFILAYSVEHLNGHVEFLRSFANLSDQEIFKIVRVYPNIVSASRDKKLHPRISFLKQCGFSSSEICKFLTKAPLFISLSFDENLAFKLVFLLKIGYQNNSKDLAMAMGAVTRCSCKNLQEVIGLFLNYGFTCEDILSMSKKHAQVLQYNYKSLEEKMDYLIEEMGREIGELLSFPAFLGYKLDSRIKHRYEVKRKIVGEGMSLNKLLSVSTATFSMRNKSGLPVDMLEDMSSSEV